jgi:hypothetical protein
MTIEANAEQIVATDADVIEVRLTVNGDQKSLAIDPRT